MVERQNLGLPEDKKWTVLPFQAQFVKSVDRTTYGRLLVFAPDQPGPGGVPCDKWVTFAIATPDQNPAPDPFTVSVVTIAKSASGNRAYFMDYARRKGLRGIELKRTSVLPGSPSKNCYDCHKSAVLPVKPEVEYGFDKNGALVERESSKLVDLNKRISQYGMVEFPNHDKAAY